VILSQVWRGVAKGLDGKEHLSASDLAVALGEGVITAYKGVMRPVEGTILTVVREAAEAAEVAAAEKGDITYVLGQVVTEAGKTLARTPDLLPVLKEAGVVDAGGQGLCVILEGMLRYLRGEQEFAVPVVKGTDRVEAQAVLGGKYGYDVQFLISGRDLQVDQIRDAIMGMGDSVLVVGDESTLKVHVHSDDPGRILSYGVSKGSVHDVVVENMQEQSEHFLAEKARDQATAAYQEADIAIVAVASGAGITRVLESLGASAVVSGGQSMNPSTKELLQAMADLPAERVIVLPNNPNIILAAQQAQQISDKEAAVIPTKTVPEGVSALLAFNHESDLKTNVDLMERAATQIQTAEITNAVRSVEIGGLRVQKGQFIALLNGELVKAGDDLHHVAQDVLQVMGIGRYDIVTVYWGDAVSGEQAGELASWICTNHPDQDVELVEGNQPHYHYIISVE
jgi:DAK2 domain fusion protein YloV